MSFLNQKLIMKNQQESLRGEMVITVTYRELDMLRIPDMYA